MSEPGVQIRNLVKRYGDRTAVDGISFDVERGTLLALLGTNGAGKTTTIEICEGFRAADSGTVRVLGLDPQADAAVLRPQVSVMLQDGVGGYNGARALELLQLFASYAADPLDPAQLLELVGLAGSAHTLVKRLSGGQQQRLSLAMALVSRPALLFLDEPTAGMDPHARRLMWDLIRTLRRDGVTMVLTTHHLAEAEELADQVVVLHAGVVVGAGTPAELTRAGESSVIRFSARSGLEVEDLQRTVAPGVRVAEISPGNYTVTGTLTPELLVRVTTWCAERDVLAEGLRVERRTLEDVFLTLTAPSEPAAMPPAVLDLTGAHPADIDPVVAVRR